MSKKSKKDNSQSGSGLLFWLLGLGVGAAGGATVAFLVAPKSGNEVRGTLKKSAKDMPEKMGEIVDDSLDLYASTLNYCQLLVEEQTTRMKKAVQAGKLAAAKKREEIELSGGATVFPLQHK